MSDVQRWWGSRATEEGQRAVLTRLALDPGYAGLPWAFLPAEVRAVLTRRVRVEPEPHGNDPGARSRGQGPL